MLKWRVGKIQLAGIKKGIALPGDPCCHTSWLGVVNESIRPAGPRANSKILRSNSRRSWTLHKAGNQ